MVIVVNVTEYYDENKFWGGLSPKNVFFLKMSVGGSFGGRPDDSESFDIISSTTRTLCI